jgi:hypothetical protein
VEVNVDKWRANEMSSRVDGPASFSFDPWLDSGDTPSADRKVQARPPVWECDVTDQQIECHPQVLSFSVGL